MTETENQILLMVWAKKISLAGRVELDLLLHIPNGGSRSGREGVMFKSMGVKAGVPDLCLPVPCGGFGSLWIEMKTTGGKVSDDQIAWKQRLESAGNKHVFAWSWKEAVEAIKLYLGGEWPEIEMKAQEARIVRA